MFKYREDKCNAVDIKQFVNFLYFVFSQFSQQNHSKWKGDPTNTLEL